MPARVIFRTTPRTGPAGARSPIEYRWSGRQVIQRISDDVNRALNRVSEEAFEYWSQVVWNPAEHPYMTGRERDAGRFVTFVGADRVRLLAYVSLSSEYPLYEEFGTRYREGHFPLRRTVDYIAPRVRELINEERGG